jgi:hypothetical protein
MAAPVGDSPAYGAVESLSVGYPTLQQAARYAFICRSGPIAGNEN